MTTRKVGDIFWSREPRPGHQGKEWAEFAIIGETASSWEVARDGRRFRTRKIPKNAPPSVDIAWTPEELAARRSEDAIASYVGRHTRRLFEAAQDFLRHISQETRLHGHSPQDLRTLCVLLGQPVDELDQILDEYNRHHPNT